MLGVVLCLGMVAVLLGYEIGYVESLVGPVVVGFTVDYTVHVGVGFLEGSRFKTRLKRTTMALTELGVCIVFGGLTTFMCVFPMCFGEIIQMYKFGFLLATTVILGQIWALIFMPAVLTLVGPQGSQGNVRAIRYLLQCRLCRARSSTTVGKQKLIHLEMMAPSPRIKESWV